MNECLKQQSTCWHAVQPPTYTYTQHHRLIPPWHKMQLIDWFAHFSWLFCSGDHLSFTNLWAGGRHDMPPPLSFPVGAKAPCADGNIAAVSYGQHIPCPLLQPSDAPTRRWAKWPGDLDLESGVRVTCDMGYLFANFGLPRPLCSRLRLNVCDRQTDVRQRHRLMPPPITAWIVIRQME